MSVTPEEILTKVQTDELTVIDTLEDKIDSYLRTHFTGTPVYYDSDGLPRLSTAGWRELQARYPGWIISITSSPKNESFWVFTPKAEDVRKSHCYRD